MKQIGKHKQRQRTVFFSFGLLLLIFVASKNAIVPTTPETIFALTGVPNFDEKVPSHRGPVPSIDAIAWIRSAPINQETPPANIARMKTTAAILSSTVPAEPYTEKTVPTASRNDETPFP